MPGDAGWPTVDHHPLPTGAHHEVAPDELFFSTTDGRGVITDANSVFVRLSRHPREELIGAPHSIIRSPDMPAGAFKLMWDTLGAGSPFCAYVDNLAADGSTYTVFATVTPLGDGYLSVRTRPMCEELADVAHALYRTVRPVELGLRAEGVNARDAAAAGLHHLGAGLAEAGVASYDDFIMLALPAEVEARAAAGLGMPARGLAEHGPLADISAGARRIAEELRAWSGRQQELASVADALVGARVRLDDQMAAARVAAQRFADAGAGQIRLAPVLLTITVWSQMMDEITTVVDALAEQLEALGRSCARTRFRIALATLHTETVGQFAAELAADGPGASPAGGRRSGADAIGALCRALHEGFEATTAQTAANAALAAQTVQALRTAHELIALPRDLMDNWKQQVSARPDIDPRVAALLPEVDEQVRRTDESLRLLAELADRCATLAVPVQTGEVEAALMVIAAADGELLRDTGGDPRADLSA